MEEVNERRLPKERSYRHCLNTIAFACFAPIRAVDRLRISSFGHFLVRLGLVRDRSQAQCEDERTFAAGGDARQEARAQATMEDANLEWTMSMAFFALSGGCVYRDRTGAYRILNHYHIKDLARNAPLSLLPVQRLVLQDPGKANAVAKLIACIQAFWFCSQCIARLGANQAVSLLELNTFAHCISALLIYICWWEKPYNAEVHAVITSSWLDMHFLVRQLSACSETVVIYGTDQDSLPELSLTKGLIVDINGNTLSRMTIYITKIGIIHREYRKLLPSAPSTNSRLRVMIPDTGLYLTVDVPHASIDAKICLRERDLDAWRVFWHAWIDLECPLPKRFPEPLQFSFGCETRNSDLDFRLILLASWREIGSITALIITLTSIVYGGLHSLAWKYSFSTNSERALWQIGSVSTSSSGLIVFASHMSRWIDPYYKRSPASRRTRNLYLRAVYSARNTISHGLLWIAYTMLLFNIASRAFLFVESFVALPNSPRSTYAIPSWTSYIPHL
jgi:hypothetical protein